MEVYGSSETGGLVTVPLNFRLSGPELMYIINNSGARVLLVSEEYVPTITAIKDDLPGTAHFICLDGAVPGMLSYEDLLADELTTDLEIAIAPDELAYIMYTSGTTGRPKGAMPDASRPSGERTKPAHGIGFCVPGIATWQSCHCFMLAGERYRWFTSIGGVRPLLLLASTRLRR